MAKLLPHQKLMVDTMVDAYKSEKKFMGLFTPPSSGKTYLLYPVYQNLKKLDHELKMIIATSQIQLVDAIYKSFPQKNGPRTIRIMGTESQVISLLPDDGRLQKAKETGMRYIESALTDTMKAGDVAEKTAEFGQCLDSAVSAARTIMDIRDGIDSSTPSVMRAKEDIIKKQQAVLSSCYVKAESLIEKAVRTTADRNIQAMYDGLDDSEKTTGEKKKETETEYVRQLKYLPDDITWLFPDMVYELADIVVLTHAKLNRSVLTKRRMLLSEINYDKEGNHIVLVADEAEVGRDSYLDAAIGQAVDSTADVLTFLNRIHSVLEAGFFKGPEYKYITKEGKTIWDASAAAEALKTHFDEFSEEYGYAPNLHIADMPSDSSLPQVTNSTNYFVGVNAGQVVQADKARQELVLIKKDKGEKWDEDEKGLMSFIYASKKLIRHFIGCVRVAAHALNLHRAIHGYTEDFSHTVGSVVYRIFGDKTSPISRYVIGNTFLPYGAKYDPSQERHPYRSDLSYTAARADRPYGGDVALCHTNVPSLPEGYMENIIANIRFAFLFSGTGWLNALNNYNLKYLSMKHSRYEPDRDTVDAIHEAYMSWKEDQYRKAGTEFYVRRIKDSGEEKNYADRDLDIISIYIRDHIKELNAHGIHGSSGAFIFPPRRIDGNKSADDTGSKVFSGASRIFSMLRQQGVDTDKVALLALQKGVVRELFVNGGTRILPEDRCKMDGDTIVINTDDGRYYYVITAHRSGTRGYNVAFQCGPRGGIYDASGLCLFELTNVIPQKDPDGEESYDKEEAFREETKRILHVNASYIHCMLLKDGEIDRDLLREAGWILHGISYGSGKIPVPKDIYPDDPWSPYKLQGTSELLQAIGRIRNNLKPPFLYVGLSNGVFDKQMLREETLDPGYLSYEAVQIYRKLPRLWAEYEEEAAGAVERSGALEQYVRDEAALADKIDNILYEQIPEAKELAAKAPARPGRLQELAAVIEKARERAVSLNMTAADSLKVKRPDKTGLWLTNRNIKKETRDIFPFTFVSYADPVEGNTVFCRDMRKNVEYLTPGRMMLTEAVDLFSPFCREKMEKNIPEIMKCDTLEAMRENDIFPYAPSKLCYDLLKTEFGKRLFLSVMQEAKDRGMTDLSIEGMPLLQYGDFDFAVKDGDMVVGYACVMYGENTPDIGKIPGLRTEKLLHSPVAGMIPVICINLMPAGERTARTYTEKNNDMLKAVNKELGKYGKKASAVVLSPFATEDVYASQERIAGIIDGHMLKKIEGFFW